ncbi:1-deoxy-D-xylulose-5-phosphate synthase, partial [uncultured Faecalibaculum sp.]
MRILDIKNPGQIRQLSMPQLETLAGDIRSFLIQSLSRTGGHLSSNLGIVELTLALHYVFESPRDKLIFDVGHQSYVHKILTGRAPEFGTLRQRHGLSGFQKREESEHDPWEAGHSSTSLSAAMGMAVARDLQKQEGEVIAVIGDGALTGGMAMEALNNIGARKEKLIIVYNDNDMSISPNHAGFKNHLTSLRSSRTYRTVKRDVKAGLEPSPVLLNSLSTIRDVLRDNLVDGGLFHEFGLDYLGPVDGHNLPELIRTLETAREHKGPVVVHVRTRKGLGFAPAQQDKTGQWHGVPPFDPVTGKFRSSSCPGEESWSMIIADTLSRLARSDHRITAITPAMANGSKLLQFAARFPDRFFDCGIAEEHAVTAAGGMAAGG